MANEAIVTIINDLFLGDEAAVSLRRTIRSSMTLNWDLVCKYIHQPSVTTQGGCAVQKCLIRTGAEADLSSCLCSKVLSLTAGRAALTSQCLQLHAASLALLDERVHHCGVNLERPSVHQIQERRKGWCGGRMSGCHSPPHYDSAGQRRRRRPLNITMFSFVLSRTPYYYLSTLLLPPRLNSLPYNNRFKSMF